MLLGPLIRQKIKQFFQTLRPFTLDAPAAVIFLYHTVEGTPTPWTQGHRYVTPFSNFKRQIAFLQKHFDIVSTSSLVETLRHGSLQRNMAAIHFDDGFRSYVDLVVPYLRSLGVSSTLFPIYACFYGHLPLRSKLAYLLNTGHQEPLRQLLPSLINTSRSTSDILAYLKNRMTSEMEQAVEDLFKQVARDHPPRSPFMTVEDLAALKQEPGVELGSHTLTHAMLSRLDEADQRREMQEGHQKLSELCGSPLPLFAYPFGGRDHFNSISQQIVREMPDVVAFSTYGGLNRSFDRTDVQRITLAQHSPTAIKRSLAASHLPAIGSMCL